MAGQVERGAAAHFHVCEAETEEDLRAALRLRQQVFRPVSAPSRADPDADRDRFDARCRHLLIRHRSSGALAATCRFMVLPSGASLHLSYAAQAYDLEALSREAGPFLELGRICVAPGLEDADILRLVWGAIAATVDREKVRMLFGCASFKGEDPARYAAAFALLRARYLAPARWAPGIAAPEVHSFGSSGSHWADPKQALAQIPPLLRSYLLIGGRVSDHAVIDRDLGTLHVFTGLEVAHVPAARVRSLRGVSSAMAG